MTLFRLACTVTPIIGIHQAWPLSRKLSAMRVKSPFSHRAWFGFGFMMPSSARGLPRAYIVEQAGPVRSGHGHPPARCAAARVTSPDPALLRLGEGAVDVDRVMQRLNPAVAWLLRSPLHPLLDWGLMLVTVTGRHSGRVYTIPVGYQRDGDALLVLVSKPSRKQWWRNYRERRPIGVWLRGRGVHGNAIVIPPESPAFREALERTLRRVPGLGRQFGIGYDRRTGLSDAQLDIVRRAAVVVRIQLDADGLSSPSAAARRQ